MRNDWRIKIDQRVLTLVIARCIFVLWLTDTAIPGDRVNLETKMTAYIIYRSGANRANQSTRERAPVAIVEAKSREAACEVDHGAPSVHAPRYCLAAPWVKVWANQDLTAKPVSKASRRDIEEAEEATRLGEAEDAYMDEIAAQAIDDARAANE